MARVCTRITNWIEEKVSRPVEEWVNEREKKCKKRHWYDPRRWLCWFVDNFVKVLRWVVVNVLKAVITIVCRLIGRVLRIIADLLEALYLFSKALVTWDKCTLQEALGKLGDTLMNALTLIGTAILDPFIGPIQRYRLQRYVRDQIDARFSDQPELAAQLRAALGIDAGLFGFHTTVQVHRAFVDSRTVVGRAEVPNLYALHRDGRIDLYKLAGFTTPCALTTSAGWYRPRPQTAKYPFASGGGSGDAIPPELEQDELDAYIKSEGKDGPHFRIYAISPGNLNTRTDTAFEHGMSLGLLLDFETREVELLREEHIKYSESAQPRFLIDVLERRDKATDPDGAQREVCRPAAVAVFGFENRRVRGLTSNVFGTTECAAHNLQPPDRTSGVTFIDDIPDQVRRYVLIHELGHYFGLCHVDGFDHIMVSGAAGQGDAFTGASILYFLARGGPRFALDEAKQAWRFILDHWSTDCLLGHPEAGDGPVVG